MLDREGIGSVILGISLRTLINLIMLFFLVEGFTYSYHFSYKLFADIPYKAGSTEVKTITIEEGISARQVAMIMNANGLVDGEYLFMAREYLGRYNTRIQAGTYELTPSMTPDEICKCICGIRNEET